MGKLICILETNCGRLWSKDVLGRTLKIDIDGRTYNIHFPRMGRNAEKLGSLEPPAIAKNLRYGNKPIYYGRTEAWPNGDSVIERVIITSETESKADAQKTAEIIDKKIAKFLDNFFKIITILSDYYGMRAEVNNSNRYFAQYNYLDQGGKHMCHLDPKSEIEMNVLMRDIGKSPNLKRIQQSLNLACAKTSIPIEYELYISATSALEDRNYRKCVLDAATATEISLTHGIEHTLERLDNNIDVKGISENCRGICRKFALLKRLGADIDGLNPKAISYHRNDVIHAGKEVDFQAAETVLNQAKKILMRFSKFW